MVRRRWISTALATALGVLTLVGTALAAPANKPAKVTWSPSRIANEVVEAGVFVVELSADKAVPNAELWVSGSLNGVLDWTPTEFEIPEDGTVEIEFTLLQTPDEAGRTLGGTVHVRADGKNLAKPLNLSLKKTQEEDPGGEEGFDEDGIVDDEGNLPVSWSLGGEENPKGEGEASLEKEDESDVRWISLAEFNEEGLAEVMMTANRDLDNVLFWITPSLKDCVVASLPEDLESEEGVLEIDEEGHIIFIAAGTTIPVLLTLQKPLEEIEPRRGTLHVRSFAHSRRTWPAVLGIALTDLVSEEEQEEVLPGAIVDAANYELGPIAPGQIVSIFGLGITPEELSIAELEAGELPDELSGISVLVDGYFMQLLAAGRGQINGVVPGQAKGHYADIVVINQGKSSAPMTVGLKKTVPKVFTAFGSGSGQAAAINPSGVLNGGASPASPGSYLSIWVTGIADPELDSGTIAEAAIPLDEFPQVRIGGVEQIVTYAGTAVGLLQAVTQINILIVEGTPSGPQPVLIIAESEESPETTTVTIE